MPPQVQIWVIPSIATKIFDVPTKNIYKYNKHVTTFLKFNVTKKGLNKHIFFLQIELQQKSSTILTKITNDYNTNHVFTTTKKKMVKHATD